MKERDYMRMAIELAKQGCGYVNPNPMVGAVIVKEGRIIGKGYHGSYGGLHAEREALANCTESPEGATIYVTLEPCCHYGKTPPCTEALIEHKIAKVVIGSPDPNPKVNGKGAAILREHGIEVVQDFLREECDQINSVFFHYIQTGIPYVVMKYAMTMDGKIATYSGKSKWITGETAREQVHRDRHRYQAIMAGIGTVLADNPMLTCRIPEGRNPVRIICDTNLRTPVDSNVVVTAREVPTWIATCCVDREKYLPYEEWGCKILKVSALENQVDLVHLMKILGEKKIDSVLLEGGGTLNWTALNSGIVKKVQTYIAPKLFGGALAKSPVRGYGVENPSEAFRLINSTIQKVGEDYLIESEVDYHVHGNC